MRFRTPAIAWIAPLIAVLMAGCGVNSAPQAIFQGQGTTSAQAVTTGAALTPARLKAMVFTDPAALSDNPGSTEPQTVRDNCFWPCPPPGDLANFGQVNSQLYRGARPTDAGMAKLKAMGVKTIVDLENAKGPVQHEADWCKANGLAFVSIPLSVILPPKVAMINQFLTLAEDPKSTPLYFHCMQGRDRTGIACFCYRISHDGWSEKQAYAEMQHYQFHWFLLGLQIFLHVYADDHHTSAPVPAPAA